MSIKSTYFILFTLLMIGSIQGQQDPTNYIFYRYNMNFVNPAYAGVEGKTEFSANIRSQWSGVDGAPETQSFLASTYLGKNVGLGISVINDAIFIEKQTSMAIDFSYRIGLGDETNLYFGLKASGNSYNANTGDLIRFGIESDPSLMNLKGGVTPNVGAGFYFQYKKLSLSISTPKIIKTDRLEQEEGIARLGKSNQHVYFMGAYELEVGNSLVLRPSSMIRYAENSPFTTDFTLSLHYEKVLGLGVAHRVNQGGLAGFLLFTFSNGLEVGYAYETSSRIVLSNLNQATHEIFMKIVL